MALVDRRDIVWFCDIATNLGYAFGPPGAKPVFGSRRFGESDTAHEYRFWRAHRWAGNFCKEFDPDVWAYETPQAGGFSRGRSNINTQLLLNGLPAAIGLQVWDYSERRRDADRKPVLLSRVDVGDIRQHFIQRRNLPGKEAKRLVIERCHALGWHVEDDNQGDACAGWSYVCSLLFPEEATTPLPLFMEADRG